MKIYSKIGFLLLMMIFAFKTYLITSDDEIIKLGAIIFSSAFILYGFSFLLMIFKIRDSSFLFVLIMIIISINFIISYQSETVYYNQVIIFSIFLKTLFWISGFIYFYSLYIKDDDNLNITKSFIYILIVFSLVLTLSAQVDSEYLDTSAAYIPLFTIPLILLNFKGGKSILLISLMSFAVLISLKRGALIILFLILLYLFFSGRKRNVIFDISKSTKIISFLFIGLVLLLTLFYFGDQILLRLYDLDTNNVTFGSGRNIIWGKIFSVLVKENIFNVILGHGFYAIPIQLGSLYNLSLQAHNDFLEIAYDFGILGFIIWSYLIYKILFKDSRLKEVSGFKQAFVILFLIIFIKSAVSGLIYRLDTIVLSLFAGQLFGLFNRKSKEIQKLNREANC